MAILRDEVRTNALSLIRGETQSRTSQLIAPTDAIPGSEEKILELAHRVELSETRHRYAPLHHPGDARMPMGRGWRIWVGANGRIIQKQQVDLDKAGLFVVLSHSQMTEATRKAIIEQFGRDNADRAEISNHLDAT